MIAEASDGKSLPALRSDLHQQSNLVLRRSDDLGKPPPSGIRKKLAVAFELGARFRNEAGELLLLEPRE
jgi:hypothetical protein